MHARVAQARPACRWLTVLRKVLELIEMTLGEPLKQCVQLLGLAWAELVAHG